MKPKSLIAMRGRTGATLNRLPAGKPVMVEVGVYVAHMAEELLSRRFDLIWHGVDNYLPREEQPQAYIDTNDVHARLDLAHQHQLRDDALRRLRPFPDRAELHIVSSVDAAAAWPPESVDLVFIDADHSREGCAADIDAWWPIVRPGGWLGGHDYKHSDARFRFGVNLAVDAFAQAIGRPVELDADNTWFIRKPLP